MLYMKQLFHDPHKKVQGPITRQGKTITSRVYLLIEYLDIFTEKDITDLSINFGVRTQANDKINFYICRNKRIEKLPHQV